LARSRQAKRDVNRFVVSGISKRGWTTWLTAASDPRVVAFAPMVIDILNMPVNVPYQRHMFGAYSLEIQDYVNLGLTEAVGSGPGKQLVDMVDPYSYRRGLSLPKLLCFGSNDEYWTADAVKNYVDSIGGHTLIQYTPNAGHSLDHGRDAVPALETFFWQTLHGGHYTKLACEVQQEGAHVHFALKASKAKLLQAELWEAVSPTLDFRKQRFERVVQMTSGKKRFRLSATLPQSGYKAFFVRCVFRHPVQGSYALCSRMYTADSKTLFDKPYQLK
jgi:PhoPQ-activated pathogenicity-related protein